MTPVEIAHIGRRIVRERYDDALAAFLAGSVVRGEGTALSDLDLVVILERPEAPFRDSFHAFGWPVEAFVNTPQYVGHYFRSEMQGRRAALATMVTEGLIVRNVDRMADRIRADARTVLVSGPAPLTPDEIETRRYTITSYLEDFEGAGTWEEAIYVAPTLAAEASELCLLLRGSWLGAGKWLRRALYRCDPALEKQLTAALSCLYHEGERGPLLAWAAAILDEAGGRLFDGYHRSGAKPGDDEKGNASP